MSLACHYDNVNSIYDNINTFMSMAFVTTTNSICVYIKGIFDNFIVPYD